MPPNMLLTILLNILDISHCVIRAYSIYGCVIAFVPYNIKYTGDAWHASQVLEYLKFHNSHENTCCGLFKCCLPLKPSERQWASAPLWGRATEHERTS